MPVTSRVRFVGGAGERPDAVWRRTVAGRAAPRSHPPRHPVLCARRTPKALSPSERLLRADAAVDDPTALGALLVPWRLPPFALARLLGPLEVGDSCDVARLVAWAAATEPVAAAEDPLARDLRVFATLPAEVSALGVTTARERVVAGVVLLSRLGEELDARERRGRLARRWPAGPRDAAARAAWQALFETGSITEAGRVAAWWGSIVSGSFLGVAAVLGLPRTMADSLAATAREQLDLVVAGAHLDVAARVVETRGEPIAALTEALGPAAWARIRACVGRRSAWSRVVDTLRTADAEPSPTQVVDAVVLHRLVENLRHGRAPAHPKGLPGWGVVVVNRARMRGRLRAAATLDPGRLAERVLALDALHARTSTTVARFAWDWAWREARTGFGFDPDRLRPPRCTFVDEPAPHPAPLGAEEHAAIRTFLLLAAGRGAWDDLLRWLHGDPGRELGRTFYRCLEALPDTLADPDAPGRRYERLRLHLVEGGLDTCLPEVQAAARAVLAVSPGRALRQRLETALLPWWDDAIQAPRHHLPGFRAGLARLLADEADSGVTE
jgi:hypothetical protein